MKESTKEATVNLAVIAICAIVFACGLSLLGVIDNSFNAMLGIFFILFGARAYFNTFS
ncbi:MAG: hypothetical protein HRU12_03770 [Phaeodactylibacter sp.]|nr:hypothetical protein [Phaeodactylibacter sp.]